MILSWEVLRIYARNKWPDKVITEIWADITPRGAVRLQAGHRGQKYPAVAAQVSRDMVAVLAAKYAQVAPFERMERAVIHVNYLSRTARVSLYYIDKNSEKHAHHEQHDGI